MVKKFIAVYIILSMLFSLTAFAADSNLLEGSCGTNAFWKLDLSTGTLEIYGSGAMQNYTEHNATPWKQQAASVKTISVAEGITSVGSYAFPWCQQVKQVTLPETVTSIGAGAFGWCNSLEQVILPKSLLSIGDNAFVWCKSLKEISIPASVSSIGKSAFSWCSALTAFSVDAGSSSYSVDNGILFNQDKTKLVAYPYGKADSAYTVPEGVTSIEDSAFLSCTKLTDVGLPTTLQQIGENAFSGCKNLQSLSIPAVQSIENSAFYGCSGLTQVVLPSGLALIGEGAFQNCTGLTYIEVPESVTQIGKDALKGTGQLTVAGYPNSTVKSYALENGVTFQDIIRVYYNGTEIAFDQKPFIENDYTLVPMRAIFETLGAVVSWDDATNTAIAEKGQTILHIQIGSSVLYKNDAEIPLGQPALLVRDRTFVPLRAVSEAFAVNVQWDEENQCVWLTV